MVDSASLVLKPIHANTPTGDSSSNHGRPKRNSRRKPVLRRVCRHSSERHLHRRSGRWRMVRKSDQHFSRNAYVSPPINMRQLAIDALVLANPKSLIFSRTFQPPPLPPNGVVVILTACLDRDGSVGEPRSTDDLTFFACTERSVGTKRTGKGRRKIGRKKRRNRARIRHRK